jgi:hypothetical protein
MKTPSKNWLAKIVCQPPGKSIIAPCPAWQARLVPVDSRQIASQAARNVMLNLHYELLYTLSGRISAEESRFSANRHQNFVSGRLFCTDVDLFRAHPAKFMIAGHF